MESRSRADYYALATASLAAAQRARSRSPAGLPRSHEAMERACSANRRAIRSISGAPYFFDPGAIHSRRQANAHIPASAPNGRPKPITSEFIAPSYADPMNPPMIAALIRPKTQIARVRIIGRRRPFAVISNSLCSLPLTFNNG
jgi:hypothetical protein